MVRKLLLTAVGIGFVGLWGGFASEKAPMGEKIEHPQWSYSGQTGPKYWGYLSPEYIMCAIGKNQSPIDLNEKYMVKACTRPLQINYVADAVKVLNNGHTIKVITLGKSYVVIDGRKFYLRQFHFHAPSEHTVNGEYYPFEAHFVHTDDEGNIAVIGVLFKLGKTNKELQKIWDYMPTKVGQENLLLTKVNPYLLLPKKKDYYRYNGSLTTPPCSEGVRWIIFKEPVEISAEQLNLFKEVMGFPNNRPIQPINARKILK